jgi:hypothetical protein
MGDGLQRDESHRLRHGRIHRRGEHNVGCAQCDSDDRRSEFRRDRTKRLVLVRGEPATCVGRCGCGKRDDHSHDIIGVRLDDVVLGWMGDDFGRVGNRLRSGNLHVPGQPWHDNSVRGIERRRCPSHCSPRGSYDDDPLAPLRAVESSYSVGWPGRA